MGYYKNDSDQPLRVDDGTGRLRRVPAGRVVQADGDFEQNLQSRGVSSASEEDYRAQSAQYDTNPTRDQQRMNAVTDAMAYANIVVHAPLNEVIGDDDAPLGPPTGTITTKQAVKDAASNSTEHHAFGHNEWTQQSAEGRELSPIQQAQADASALSAEVAQAGIEGNFDPDAQKIKGISGPEKRGGRADGPRTETRKKPGPKPKAQQAEQPPSENV